MFVDHQVVPSVLVPHINRLNDFRLHEPSVVSVPLNACSFSLHLRSLIDKLLIENLILLFLEKCFPKVAILLRLIFLVSSTKTSSTPMSSFADVSKNEQENCLATRSPSW